MKMTRTCVTLVAMGVLCFLQQLSAQEKKFVSLPHRDPSTAQGMEGGVWRTDLNFESILQLKNVLINHEITATPILYMADGTEYPLQPVTLAPAGVASVNIGTALNDMPAALSRHRSGYGMVGVRYNWSWPAAVMALVRNIDEAEMVSFQSTLHSDVNEAHLTSSATQAPQQIEGLWWNPYETTTGFMVLSNTRLAPIAVTIAAYDASGSAMNQKSVELKAHSTQWVTLADVLGKEPTVHATGSFAISYAGAANSLSAIAGLEDDTTGFSATLNLVELHPEQARNPAEHQVVLDPPGIMAGKQLPAMQFLVDSAFTPYAFLHNTAPQARQVSLSMTFAGPGGPQTNAIGQVVVGPNETWEVAFKRTAEKRRSFSLAFRKSIHFLYRLRR